MEASGLQNRANYFENKYCKRKASGSYLSKLAKASGTITKKIKIKMKKVQPLKSEIVINLWVKIPDPSIASAVKEIFLETIIAQNSYEIHFSGVEVDANEGLLTVKSSYLSLSADEHDFLDDLAGDWDNAILEVQQEVKKLKSLGVCFQ